MPQAAVSGKSNEAVLVRRLSNGLASETLDGVLRELPTPMCVRERFHDRVEGACRPASLRRRNVSIATRNSCACALRGSGRLDDG